MKALVTGFEPFGGERLNASWEAVRRLPSRIGRIAVATARLPTSFARSAAVLDKAIARERPGIVLCVGEARERPGLSLERVAVNLQDARIPDNDGRRPRDAPVVPGAPAAYFAGLPVKKAVQALLRAGLPAEISMSAGTFVCNHVFYRLLHDTRAQPAFLAGFLHVPGAAAVPPGDTARAIAIVLETAAAAHARAATPGSRGLPRGGAARRH